MWHHINYQYCGVLTFTPAHAPLAQVYNLAAELLGSEAKEAVPPPEGPWIRTADAEPKVRKCGWVWIQTADAEAKV